MSYLTLNGIAVPVAYGGQPTRQRVYLGGRGERAYNGSARNDAHATLWDFKGRTILQTSAETVLCRVLIEGVGHTLDFEITDDNPTGLASSRGVLPTVVGTAASSDGFVHTGFGDVLFVDTASSATWALGLSPAWTVLYWRLSAVDTWTHYIVRSDGAKWVNGVRNDAESTPYLSVTSGSLALTGLQAFDDVVALPYAIADDWGATLFTFHAMGPFPLLPLVVASGDSTHNVATTCLGTVADAQQNSPGALLESFDFTLIESAE